MIETVEELHEYVNRYHVTARIDDIEGRLSIRGGKAVGISYKTERGSWLMLGVDEADIGRLEIGTSDSWVSLEDFDEKATAQRIERFEKLSNLEMATDNYLRAATALVEAHEALGAEDQDALQLPEFPIVPAPPVRISAHREAIK